MSDGMTAAGQLLVNRISGEQYVAIGDPFAAGLMCVTDQHGDIFLIPAELVEEVEEDTECDYCGAALEEEADEEDGDEIEYEDEVD